MSGMYLVPRRRQAGILDQRELIENGKAAGCQES
jgi:hypothetical protein